MKILFGTTFIILGVFSIVWLIMWYTWVYPKNYEYNLRLADDASRPEDKANYLKLYLEDISKITGEPRWIFKMPDINKEKQIEITEGLITRLQDVARLDPSELSYQQGIYQITGQEMEHQLNKISNVFQSAKVRENSLNAIFMWWGWLIFGLLSAVMFILKKRE